MPKIPPPRTTSHRPQPSAPSPHYQQPPQSNYPLYNAGRGAAPRPKGRASYTSTPMCSCSATHVHLRRTFSAHAQQLSHAPHLPENIDNVIRMTLTWFADGPCITPAYACTATTWDRYTSMCIIVAMFQGSCRASPYTAACHPPKLPKDIEISDL